jgi:hypothetical protein
MASANKDCSPMYPIMESELTTNFLTTVLSVLLKYSKDVLRCKNCNQKVRTRPWHGSKLTEWKRIELFYESASKIFLTHVQRTCIVGINGMLASAK